MLWKNSKYFSKKLFSLNNNKHLFPAGLPERVLLAVPAVIRPQTLFAARRIFLWLACDNKRVFVIVESLLDPVNAHIAPIMGNVIFSHWTNNVNHIPYSSKEKLANIGVILDQYYDIGPRLNQH
jgi:hypothetical protein